MKFQLNSKIKVRKSVGIAIIIFLLFCSFKKDISGTWVVNEREHIKLYTGPVGYHEKPSPDSVDIRQIMEEHEKVIDSINEKLKTDFNDIVEIFLFNYDEAKEKIGTNGGGP